MMHPFCWCEGADCPWCRACTCLAGEPDCDNCVNPPAPEDYAPNFLFKPTGGSVRWYKYIGRGMRIDGEIPHTFVATCLESL